jgi:hypothetical protein
MRHQQHSQTPWLTCDFEQKFREAFGREMHPRERQFFGMQEQVGDRQLLEFTIPQSELGDSLEQQFQCTMCERQDSWLLKS